MLSGTMFGGELLHQRQSLRTNVVLYPFGVDGGRLFVGPQSQQEVENDCMSSSTFLCQSPAFGRQTNRRVGFRRDKAITLQTSDGLIDGHTADLKVASQIDASADAVRFHDFRNGFHVIFHGFCGVIITCS